MPVFCFCFSLAALVLVNETLATVRLQFPMHPGLFIVYQTVPKCKVGFVEMLTYKRSLEVGTEW